MYINKTSRKIIFFNAIIFAWLVIFIAGKFGIAIDFSAFNFAAVSLFSVVFESLRLLNVKKKIRRITKKIRSKIYLGAEPSEELQAEMEEM